MIGSAQSAHLVDSVILSRHTACLAPPNVAILRMYTSSESHFLLPAKRLALRMYFSEAEWLYPSKLPARPSKIGSSQPNIHFLMSNLNLSKSGNP